MRQLFGGAFLRTVHLSTPSIRVMLSDHYRSLHSTRCSPTSNQAECDFHGFLGQTPSRAFDSSQKSPVATDWLDLCLCHNLNLESWLS